MTSVQTAALPLSIIVPVYNAAPWLDRCLAGIAGQTFRDWECLLIDDGSTDESGAICDAWQQKDPRFVAVHQKNAGVSAARNRGLSLAKGEQIAFCDADDAFAPTAMEYALAMHRQAPEAMVIWGFTTDPERFVKDPDALDFSVLPKAAFDGVAWVGILYNAVWNRLFDAEKLRQKQLLFRDELGQAGAAVICEDGEFVARYLDQCAPSGGWQIAYCPAPLYYYAQDNTASLSTTATGTGALENGPDLRENLDQILKQEWDGLLAYAPAFPEGSCLEPDAVVHHYLAAAAQLAYQYKAAGRPMDRALLHHPCLENMLAYCKKAKLYSPYYLPLRTGNYALAAHLWLLDATENHSFGRWDWLGYYLLGGRWNRA